MGIRSLLARLSTTVEEDDAQRLRAFCAQRGQVPISEIAPRTEVTAVGQISSIRIVPHQASSWLEVTMSDGDDSLVIMWTGRRSIAGVAPGRRLAVKGRALPLAPGSRRLKMLNPAYELLGKD